MPTTVARVSVSRPRPRRRNESSDAVLSVEGHLETRACITRVRGHLRNVIRETLDALALIAHLDGEVTVAYEAGERVVERERASA